MTSKYIEITNRNTKIIDDTTQHLRFTDISNFNTELLKDDYITREYGGGWFRGDLHGEIYGVAGTGIVFHSLNYFLFGQNNQPNKPYMYITEMNSGTLNGYDWYGLHLRPSSLDIFPSIIGDSSWKNQKLNINNIEIVKVEQGPGNTSSKIGMQIFDDSGQVIFDSGNKYTDIIDVIQFTDWGFDPNKEYKYDVPIAVVPLTMSAWNSLKYGQRQDNYSSVELLCCYMNSEKSFKLLRLKKTGASGTTRSFQKEGWVTRQTVLLVLDATSIS